MRFNIGETVGFMHEVGGGKVISYKNNFIVIVEDETGFDREFPENELVKIVGNQEDSVTIEPDYLYEIPDSVGQSAPRGVTKMNDFWEIDLHTHNILDTERGLSNYQILTRQLYEFKQCLKEARKKKIHKFVVIHGVGEGTLKTEVRKHLEERENLEFYDADFRDYGKGATEIRLYYK